MQQNDSFKNRPSNALHHSLIKEAGIDNPPYNFEFQKILHGVLRHIPLILLITALSTLLAAFISHKLMHTFNAQAVLIYSQQRTGKTVEENYQILHLTLPSAVEMVTLPVHLKAVKSILGLDLSIEKLQEMISVAPPAKDSNFVTINVTANNPNLAVDIANTLANVVVKNTQDLSKKQWQAAYAFFKNQETMLKQKLYEQNRALAQFKKEHQLMGMDLGSTSYLENLKNAQEKLQTANFEYTRMLVEYENLKQEYEKIPSTYVPSLSNEDPFVKNRIGQIQIALLDARTRYAPENPKIKALESQLEELMKSVAESNKIAENTEKPEEMKSGGPLKDKLNLDLIGMQAKIQALARLREEMGVAVKEYQGSVSVWNEERAEFSKLLNGQVAIENQLKNNEEMQRTVEIMLNLAKGDLELYQTADKAFSYENSLLVDFLPTIGFIVGSLLGLGGAFIAEISDKKIRTAKQIDHCYNIPCLVSIPQFRFLSNRNLDAKILVYVKSLVERLSLLGPFFSLAVTSSKSNEGKSFVIHYISLVYARLGKKVLILELDPKQNPFYPEEVEPTKLFESYLRGNIELDEIISHGQVDRIKGGFDNDMAELLSGAKMQNCMQLLKQKYDIVLIEAPAILEEDSAIKATGIGEKSIFVVGSSKVKKYFIDSSLKDLEVYNIKPCGIILNRVLRMYMDNLRLAAQHKKHEKGFFDRWFSRKSVENTEKTDL